MLEEPRDGQIRALRVILERWTNNESYTSIVLPTRYGKSDVIRAGALQGIQQGLISSALVLSPNGFLVGQFVKDNKWESYFQRFSNEWLTAAAGFSPITFIPSFTQLRKLKLRIDSHIISTTIQLVERNADTYFVDFVESVRNRTGKPVAVFVDESQTGSDENEWGRGIEKLAQAGARVVLLTAIAERSDGKRIPGFRFTEVSREDITVSVPTRSEKPGKIIVNIYEGVKRQVKLIPDFEIGFSQAFAEGALAHINYSPMDATVVGSECDAYSGLLSDCPVNRVSGVLDKLLRDNAFIERCCVELVKDLRICRSINPRSLAMVFCGNDEDRHGATRGDNQHLKKVKAVLRRVAPEFRVDIVTSNPEDSTNEESEDRLLNFCEGLGADIALVKQMAGLGLDSSLLKVGLDLSSIRAHGASVQRMMRVATPPPSIATWITPDDIPARANFQRVVADQGGDAPKVTDLSLLRSYEVDKKEEDKPKYSFDEIKPGASEDSHGERADKDYYPLVQRVLSAFPILRSHYTDVYIAKNLTGFALSEESETVEVQFENTGAKAEAVRLEINTMAKQSAAALMRVRGYGVAYGDVIQDIYGTAKRMVDWPYGVELSQLDDIKFLVAVRDAMLELRGIAQNGQDIK